MKLLYLNSIFLLLNNKKLCLKLSKVGYIGHIPGADVLQADPERIKAVHDAPRTSDVQGIQHLIGVVTLQVIATF